MFLSSNRMGPLAITLEQKGPHPIAGNRMGAPFD